MIHMMYRKEIVSGTYPSLPQLSDMLESLLLVQRKCYCLPRPSIKSSYSKSKCQKHQKPCVKRLSNDGSRTEHPSWPNHPSSEAYT